MKEDLTIRPYARLLTMLGEQLIKNGQIALVELIKNSYDADASFVKVSFVNFTENLTNRPDSYIVIEDDGNGMDEQILKKSWLNPATPTKLKQKKIKQTTDKGRIIQGEKGIGRFAIFKLGRSIEIITRRQLQDENNRYLDYASDTEYVISYDFSKYDNDFLTEDGKDKELYLDDLSVSFEKREPVEIITKEISLGSSKIKRKPYGTKIIIRDLNTKWNADIVKKVSEATGKMQPLFDRASVNKKEKPMDNGCLKTIENSGNDFQIVLYRDDKPYISPEEIQTNLLTVLNDKSVFVVVGEYSEEKFQLSMNIDNHTTDKNYVFDATSPELTGIAQYKNYFAKLNRKTECGDFSFRFYIFDLDSRVQSYSKFILGKEEKEAIKNHRIYLYRDDIRVMPYGDPDDDWLNIDSLRGTESASALFSNDQVVGFVYITQTGNPNLRDKTNREGLIEDGHALEDFINVVQLFLRYIRSYPYKKYLLDKKKKQEYDLVKEGRSLDLIKKAKNDNKDDNNMMEFLDIFEKTYKKEHDILSQRISRTENLAAIGLSVQTASHDTMILLKRTVDSFDNFMKMIKSKRSESLDRNNVSSLLQPIQESLAVINKQMSDIQKLFPSTKTRTKKVDVKIVIEKINRLYSKALTEHNIVCEMIWDNIDIEAKATDAVFMQVFINLFDNALYWLQTIQGERKIKIEILGGENKVVFSDNGPGVNKEYAPYIFDAFFSGKGEDGKGLGLYIAQQLLDRYGYSISLVNENVDKCLDGATFVLDLSKEKSDGE